MKSLYIGNYTNSVDPEEMLLNVAAHQALTRLTCHTPTERQLFRMVLVNQSMIMDYSI